jgi:hydroxymethylpyrimidine/phosphomethylpyrimidine kinase
MATRLAQRRPKVPVVAVVAGCDPTGGAGIVADVRSLEALGVYPAAIVTAVTVQDGARVMEVSAVAPELVRRQLECVLDNLPVRVVKCGMLARPATTAAVAAAVGRREVALVLDPVLRASGGEALASRGMLEAMRTGLVPLATVVTANLDEAARLTGLSVANEEEMVAAGRRLLALGARAAVVKGGHLAGEPVDVLCHGRRVVRYPGGRIGQVAMHGSGCAFASALAAGLARGRPIAGAVEYARAHVRDLISRSWSTQRGARLRPAGKADRSG